MNSIKVYIIAILLCACITGCTHLPASQLGFKDYFNKKVVLNCDSVLFKSGKLAFSDFRIQNPNLCIVYVDEDCGMCHAETRAWIREKVKFPCPGKLSCLFVFRGNSFDDFVRSKLGEGECFPYPVLADSSFRFLNDNKHIPLSVLSNPVLLDKADRIKAIGDPLSNPDVRRWYEHVVE